MTAIATHKRWFLSILQWDGDGERETLETLRGKHLRVPPFITSSLEQLSTSPHPQLTWVSASSALTEQAFLRNTFLQFLGHVAQLKVIPCFSVSCPPKSKPTYHSEKARWSRICIPQMRLQSHLSLKSSLLWSLLYFYGIVLKWLISLGWFINASSLAISLLVIGQICVRL